MSDPEEPFIVAVKAELAAVAAATPTVPPPVDTFDNDEAYKPDLDPPITDIPPAPPPPTPVDPNDPSPGVDPPP